MESLSSLAATAAGGDAAATANLLERVWPDAFRIAWSVLAERTAAEDAAQEACARLLTSIATLRNPEAFKPWFYRIVVNESKRRLGAGGDAALRQDRGQQQGPAWDDGASWDDRLDLRRALSALDPPLRVATILFYYYDLSGNEIARIVGASTMTVRWRLFLARKRLRAMLCAQPQSPLMSTNRRKEYADEPQAVR